MERPLVGASRLRYALRGLIRRRRVPKRQKTVKVEPFDGLNCTQIVEPSRQRGQSHCVQHDRGGDMQEGEVAEAAAEMEVAHRQAGADVLFAPQPGLRGLFVADFVDEL